MKSVTGLFVVGVFLGCVLFPFNMASAQIRTIQVTGVVDSISTGNGITLDGSVDVGTVMTGSCTYSIATPDTDDSDYSGSYEMLSMTMNVGNYSFFSDSRVVFNTFVTDATFKLVSLDNHFTGTIYDNGVAKTHSDYSWETDNTKLFYLCNPTVGNPNDDLPESFPELSFFEDKDFSINYEMLSPNPATSNDVFLISGEVTSIEIVPEPAMLSLLALGGLGLLRKRRIRR